MEDQHRWRDRVEISLDNRQIFLLFSASAVILSLVFALGVVVGKRVEADTSEHPQVDPLALLDQLSDSPAADEPESLSYTEALTGDRKRHKPAAHEPAAPAPKPIAKPIAEPVAKRGLLPAPAAASQSSPGSDLQVSNPSREPDPAEGKPDAPEATAKRTVVREPQRAIAPKLDQPPEQQKRAEAPAADARYTLQLSSFQDRLEAEQFVNKLEKAGAAPRIQPTQIPGRGLWYRVRLGDFPSWERALAAKDRFEREHNVIAYVARR